jgi:uncharacterized protein (DUF1697 family)
VATYIALLRAINVGGNNKLPMADLRAMVERAGGRDVRTYIQSGNVVFTHPARSEASVLAKLSAEISAPIILRTPAELAATRAKLPFDAERTYVVFLPAAQTVSLKVNAPERYQLVGRDLYLFLPGGVGSSKLAAAANKLGGTARNWRTVEALCQLAGV